MFRLILAFLLLAAPAAAQTAPSAAEIAAYTGLHRAAYDGDAGAIRQLIAEGADVNARDRRRRTPSIVAAFRSQDAALKSLAEGGADMNAQDEVGYDVVTIAAVAGDADLMSLALDLGNRPDLIHTNWDGTALIAASELGHVEVVRRLVAAGSPLDHVNNLGWTALLEAVILGDGGPAHQETVRILVEGGADRTIADRDGLTPMDHAKARGFKEIMSILAES
ncbi:MAG TPA: ankyrin repeat domain-containing protein [Albidovulum sp.]|uniref:ankyrin repeat domain-containing protein n=1 Tax=Albidovulum sp. TaxID=1872424 RepID=UPI002BD64407|nr:ankyrin repeat domain-containing protein [Albidovulum sp.]